MRRWHEEGERWNLSETYAKMAKSVSSSRIDCRSLFTFASTSAPSISVILSERELGFALINGVGFEMQIEGLLHPATKMLPEFGREVPKHSHG